MEMVKRRMKAAKKEKVAKKGNSDGKVDSEDSPGNVLVPLVE